MTRIVQLKRGNERRVAVVEEPRLRLLDQHDTVYALAQAAMASGKTLSAMVQQHAARETIEYDPIYQAKSDWRLLPQYDSR